MVAPRIQIPTYVEHFFRTHRKGRRRLLALTYEFDPSAFERAFESVLKQDVQVDIVAGVAFSGTSSDARLWGARWPGTFHPKMLCLLANDVVSIGLGSANMTSSGLRENLETWAYFEGRHNWPVLSGVRVFLQKLEQEQVLPAGLDTGEIIAALPAADGPGDVLSTLHGTLIDQILLRTQARVRRVDLITPIHSDISPIIRRLHEAIGGKDYRIYSGDLEPPRVHGIHKYYSLKRPQEPEDGLRTIGLVHAKAYAFYGSRYVDVFWGSANISRAAWMSSGRAANIDVLVHARVPIQEWERMRDKTLPVGHSWELTKALAKEPKKILDRTPAWRLLHAELKHQDVTVGATASGDFSVLLKSNVRLAPLRVSLSFSKEVAMLPREVSRELGFGNVDAPRSLHWRRRHADEWREIPVNRMDSIGAGRQPMDLAQQLYWEFSGRTLPRPDKPPAPQQQDLNQDQLLSDEEELTSSDHQGEMDRFVLEWRAIAQRMAQACGRSSELRRFQVRRIMARLSTEAAQSPSIWPGYRISFIRQLLERDSWHG